MPRLLDLQLQPIISSQTFLFQLGNYVTFWAEFWSSVSQWVILRFFRYFLGQKPFLWLIGYQTITVGEFRFYLNKMTTNTCVHKWSILAFGIFTFWIKLKSKSTPPCGIIILTTFFSHRWYSFSRRKHIKYRNFFVPR